MVKSVIRVPNRRRDRMTCPYCQGDHKWHPATPAQYAWILCVGPNLEIRRKIHFPSNGKAYMESGEGYGVVREVLGPGKLSEKRYKLRPRYLVEQS